MRNIDAIKKKLNEIITIEIRKRNYNTALTAISALAQIYYEENQCYIDPIMEQSIHEIGENLELLILAREEQISNVVFFYDGFGLDTRGLAIIYITALCKLGKKVVYVTKNNRKSKQPVLEDILTRYGAKCEFVPDNVSQVDRARHINNLINKYRPANIFIYITPYDAASVLVFNSQIETKRIQINLTDHAFWLGRDMFDYCIEFRNYGVTISNKYRLIDIDKLVLLPFYPYIVRKEYKGLPFDSNGKKIILSGGALYKTNSTDNLYYVILDEILSKHQDVVFLYIGSGDTTKLDELVVKYPNRVFWSPERDDFFNLLEECYFYINTYPFAGGLMTQYAVAAGKLPVTLKANQDADDILVNQEKLSVFYSDYKELLADVDMMLQNQEYLSEKEKQLKNCLITENIFVSQLDNILQYGKNDFEIKLQELNVEKLQEDYRLRFADNKADNVIAKFENRALFKYYPLCFLKKIVKKIITR